MNFIFFFYRRFQSFGLHLRKVRKYNNTKIYRTKKWHKNHKELNSAINYRFLDLSINAKVFMVKKLIGILKKEWWSVEFKALYREFLFLLRLCHQFCLD